MQQISRQTVRWLEGTALAALLVGAASMAQAADISGLVFTESNAASNSVLEFDRAANGSLSLADTVATGGAGGGVVSVGSQGEVAVSQNQQYIFAVNEGGGSVSVLQRNSSGGLTPGQTVSTGGNLPVSIAVSGNLVYVLNDGVNGSPASITGFTFNNSTGTLTPIANSTRSLSAPSPTAPAIGPIAAQIQFDKTGQFLYVTEPGTSLIDTYTINSNGTPSADVAQPSFGNTPFAIAVTPQNQLLVAQIGESLGTTNEGSLSSYTVGSNGALTLVSGSVADSQTAPCWVVVTPNGEFAYVVNTASGTISAYRVNVNGQLTLLNSGISATIEPGILDNATLGGDLYVVDSRLGGAIDGFQEQADGSLTPLNFDAAVPLGSRGLAAIAVPEPASWALLLIGIGAMGGALRSRRRSVAIPA